MPEFDIIVVGAGLAGIAAAIGLRKEGNKVRVVESTSVLSVIGDAIAVGANQQCVLAHYGILEDLHARAVNEVGYIYQHRYANHEIIATIDLQAQQKNYGYNIHVLSRTGYQDFLYEQAKKIGVEFQFASRVKSIDDSASRPAIILMDDTRMEADIIVGADGVKSAVRQSLFPDAKTKSDWSCYRAVIPHEKLNRDPDLVPYTTGMHVHMAPGSVTITGNMTDVSVLAVNIYTHNDAGSAASWKAPADPAEIREICKDYSPQAHKMLDLIDKCVVWKVVEVGPLDSWISNGGKVVLLGDAAHAMTPNQGQGCSTGVEDGAVLAECIRHAKSLEDVPALLRSYEEIRKPRTSLVQSASAMLGQISSIPDGPQQQERDDIMKMQSTYAASMVGDGKPVDIVPSGLMDPTYQPWLLGYNGVDFTRRKLGSA